MVLGLGVALCVPSSGEKTANTDNCDTLHYVNSLIVNVINEILVRNLLLSLVLPNFLFFQLPLTTTFSSLSNGHPKFGQYPFKRRSRINFDHTKHFQTHFRDKNVEPSSVPSGCTNCHQPDTKGSTMQVRGFEQVCSICHAGQIEGVARASAKGIEIFTVPGLDVETLIEKDVAIGAWPEDSESENSPFMDIFLAGEPNYVEARKSLKETDLLDLADASKQELAAANIMSCRFDVLIPYRFVR